MTEESNKETQIQIGSLKNQYESNKQELLQRIITLICDIKPEAHINARLQWKEEAKPTHFYLISFFLIIPTSRRIVFIYSFYAAFGVPFRGQCSVSFVLHSIYIYLRIDVYLFTVYFNQNKRSSLEKVMNVPKKFTTSPSKAVQH